MRFKAIFCEVLARQVYHVAAFSPHVVDVELVRKGLHTDTDALRAELQRRLDAPQESECDAVLLGYGLCSNSIVGLVCAHTKVVVPRAHDCITLYLGSKERYGEEFREHPGTYWYTADYVERGGDNGDRVALGSSGEGQEISAVYEEYVARYGQDNADYLMEAMGAWRQHYDRAAYIDTPEMRLPDYSGQVRELASRRGWSYERMVGSLRIIRDLVEGKWDDERFLVVPPGHTVLPTYDQYIVEEGQPPGE